MIITTRTTKTTTKHQPQTRRSSSSSIGWMASASSISISIAAVGVAFFTSMETTQSFTITSNYKYLVQRDVSRILSSPEGNEKRMRGRGRGVMPLHIASLPRTDSQKGVDDLSSIDNELHHASSSPSTSSSSSSPSAPSSSSTSSTSTQSSPYSSSSSSSIMNEIHSILDDGNGHINKELAASIWNWENDHLHPVESNPFPFASKLGNYSTRDGLRLVESIAMAEMERQSNYQNLNLYSYGGTDKDSIRYNDLVQEGVVSLMKAMVVWDNDSDSDSDSAKSQGQGSGEDFESFAAREITKSMKKLLEGSLENRKQAVATAGAAGVAKGGIADINTNVNTNVNANIDNDNESNENESQSQSSVFVSVDQEIMNPLTKVVLDENPTPDEIALSEMIRHDICDFLERTLNAEELQVIRMRFGLGLLERDDEEYDDKNVNVDEKGSSMVVVGLGTSSTLEDIAMNLSKSIGEVRDIERGALAKLRTSFSNDYIGAYLDDDDHIEEVSL
eukprot:CAMPEP_0203667810 /NCGR_PEP_ID=MMETSP0090-20130426/4566_1 /ASSEMBLY_ACC=CAM_ASM_001088 /TAXON_ID=426623 /ORGANISM="Chaetoceros affinis, Strain CCMP159" /LENGTH=503 /DNA_ID=CAMNT_0050532079 /DNA_START=128 /DNA_END=1639 /DNA_ORIENTATION=+